MSKFTLSTNLTPQVSIIGSGAMGLLYGAFLSGSGCRVTMLTRRPEVAEAIREGGIDFEEGGKTRNYGGIAALTDLSAAAPPDLVIVCVKGPYTSSALDKVAGCIPRAASVLTLQNGLGNVEAIAARVPKEQILAGVSYTGATLLGPNLVRMGGRGPIHLGELRGGLSARLLALAQIFERSGFRTNISENIQGLIWTKVLVNAGINPVAALTRLKNRELASGPESRELMAGLVREGAFLAEMLGIKLDTADPVALTMNVALNTGANMASMLQDVLQGKKTEIESINGMLVEMAREQGLELPLNKTVTMLIRLLERAK